MRSKTLPTSFSRISRLSRRRRSRLVKPAICRPNRGSLKRTPSASKPCKRRSPLEECEPLRWRRSVRLRLRLVVLFQQLDQASEFLVDLTHVIRREFTGIGRSMFRALRLLVADHRHEIGLKKHVVFSALPGNGVASHVALLMWFWVNSLQIVIR